MEGRPLLYVVISAALFGISPPVAKVLLEDLDPVALAGLLYLGAFIGLTIVSIMRLPVRPRRRWSARTPHGWPWGPYWPAVCWRRCS